MQNITGKTVIVLLVSILLTSPTFLRINTAPPPPTTMYVDPSSLTVNAGTNFTVNIDVVNVMNLWEFGFYLNYTATLMNATSVVLGPFLNPPNHVISSQINNTAGWVIFMAKSDSGAPPANGGGILAAVTFICLGENMTPLHLYNTILLDPSLALIPHGTIDGNVTQESPWYVKPSYPDYAPSGMPDFDERQDNWGTNAAQGYYTWCAPTAVADSLWWLDSKFESLMFANPVPPPAISDHFNLVNSSNPGVWDDHDPNNVMSLVTNLALLMDTDGMASGDGHNGTRWTDIQTGIQKYLAQQGVAGIFEVHKQSFPSFAWIDNQTEKCQDVELCIEFWQQTGPGTWTNESTVSERIFQFGHCVACAGVNATTSQVLVCDPAQDAFQLGWGPGRSPIPPPTPFNTSIHNDAQYVSQDAYNVTLFDASQLPPPFNTTPPGYPQQVWELQNYLAGGYHAFIRYAFAVSPQTNVVPVNVESSKDKCSPEPTVGKGYSTDINATVVNNGSDVVSFTVTVYANSTALGNTIVSNLAPGANVTVTVATWNTTTWAYGHYFLTVATNASYANFTSSLAVWVVLQGDINGDGTVNILDAITLGNAFLTTPSSSSWNPNADINGDNVVNILDAIILSNNFLKSQSYDP